MHTGRDSEGERVFQRKKSILNALFRVICKAELKHCFWFGWFDHFLFTLFLAHPTRRTSPGTSCHRWQPISVFWCLFFACRFPNIGNSSQLWSDSKLEQTWTWLPLTLDSVLVMTLPTGLSILCFVFSSSSSVASFDCYCFWIPSSQSFLFCWFWADFWLQVFQN